MLNYVVFEAKRMIVYENEKNDGEGKWLSKGSDGEGRRGEGWEKGGGVAKVGR